MKYPENQKLTQKRIDRLTHDGGARPNYYRDGETPGLAVRVMPSGTKSFCWIGRVHGKKVFRTLGRVGVITLTMARQRARFAAVEADQAREDLEAGVDSGGDGLTVQDAFDAALARANRGETARRDWESAVQAFMAWLHREFPALTLWRQLTRAMLDRYEGTLTGKSPNRRRLLLQPIRQTGRRMRALYGLPDPSEALQMSNKTIKPPPAVHLADVVRFLDWCRWHAPFIEAGAALQGLAALRPSEAVRLRWSKVDLRRGAVEVSGQVKNEYSRRVVPIPARAVEALERARVIRPEGKVREADPHVVVTETGFAYEGGSAINWGKAVLEAVKAWAEAETAGQREKEGPGAAAFAVPWKGKDLRNCVPQFCERRGIGGGVLEAYIGHAARGVTAQHYVGRLAASSFGEREALEESLAMFRRLILAPLEAEIERLSSQGGEGTAQVQDVAGDGGGAG